jgi:O-antigen ligase
VIIPGIIILVLLFSFSPALRQRIKALGHFKSYAISSRFHQWQSGLEMMLDHPLTGVGPGNYEVLYKQYKFFEERKTYSHAHSNIVQIGAETGILGLSMFFWMMVAAFIIIWSRVKQIKEPFFFSLSLGALAAFLAFHFAGLFEYNFGDSEVQLLLWFILGSLEKI